jgi:hypothetical protein
MMPSHDQHCMGCWGEVDRACAYIKLQKIAAGVDGFRVSAALGKGSMGFLQCWCNSSAIGDVY